MPPASNWEMQTLQLKTLLQRALQYTRVHVVDPAFCLTGDALGVALKVVKPADSKEVLRTMRR